MAEFDSHAIIRKLAEAEWQCLHHDTYLGPDLQFHGDGCAECGGTGCIVPFASLRVECECKWPSVHLCANTIEDCEGRGWIPEPDVEKACWRIFTKHPRIIRDMIAAVSIYGGYEVEEAVLRAAEAWLDAQMKEAQRR